MLIVSSPDQIWGLELTKKQIVGYFFIIEVWSLTICH